MNEINVYKNIYFVCRSQVHISALVFSSFTLQVDLLHIFSLLMNAVFMDLKANRCRQSVLIRIPFQIGPSLNAPPALAEHIDFPAS